MDEPTQPTDTTEEPRQPGGDPSDAPASEGKTPPQEADPGSGDSR